MKNGILSLVVNTTFCELPGERNDYFTFEDRDGMNTEEGFMRLPFRRFVLKHPQRDQFLNILGNENTMIFHKVMLSFFDAAVMLNDFTKRNENLLTDIDFGKIEKEAANYNIDSFEYNSVEADNYLAIFGFDNYGRDYHFEEYRPTRNQMQELLWAMNLEEILRGHGITYYEDRSFEEAEKRLNNFNLLIYKMLKSREIGMVMHTWRKLSSYDKTDFIGNISNLLEFIVEDFIKNPTTFNTSYPEYETFVKLHRLVNTSKRPYYFRIFNSAELLGFISRHGAHLIKYDKLSENTVLKMKTIKRNMENGIIPSEKEIQYMFNVWHLTTSLIVSLWFRLKKLN